MDGSSEKTRHYAGGGNPRWLMRSLVSAEKRSLLVAAGLFSCWSIGEAMVPAVIGGAVDQAIGPSDRGALLLWLVLLTLRFVMPSFGYLFGALVPTRRLPAEAPAAHDDHRRPPRPVRSSGPCTTTSWRRRRLGLRRRRRGELGDHPHRPECRSGRWSRGRRGLPAVGRSLGRAGGSAGDTPRPVYPALVDAPTVVDQPPPAGGDRRRRCIGGRRPAGVWRCCAASAARRPPPGGTCPTVTVRCRPASPRPERLDAWKRRRRSWAASCSWSP